MAANGALKKVPKPHSRGQESSSEVQNPRSQSGTEGYGNIFEARSPLSSAPCPSPPLRSAFDEGGSASSQGVPGNATTTQRPPRVTLGPPKVTQGNLR